MNEPEARRADSSEVAELEAECAELQRQGTLLRVALIVIGGTLAAFLFVQVWRTGKDTESLRAQQRQILEASQREEPSIRALIAKLAEYGRTHPDFAPIMAKYGISQTSSVPTAATAPKP